MSVTNQILLEEIRANRSEILELAKTVAEHGVTSTEQHRRITEIERSHSKVSWVILGGGATFITSLAVLIIGIIL